MKKWFYAGMIGFLGLAVYFIQMPLLSAAEPSAEAIRSTPAFQHLSKRPSSELAKLIYLIERFQELGVTVIYEQHEYPPAKAASFARQFLAKNYREESLAETWVRKYCYRSEHSNALIQFRFPDGSFQPARDVLLTELGLVNKVLSKA